MNGSRRSVILEARGLSKAYGEQLALDGVDFQAQAGRMTVIVGESGSGKSSLLEVISGIAPADAGEVRHYADNGQRTSVSNLGGAALEAWRAHEVGYVFQSADLIGGLTAADNVTIAQDLAGVPTYPELIGEATERLGLASHMSKYPAELSGGLQQRVAILSALAHSPSMIVADEPTAALDSRNTEVVHELLRDVVVGRFGRAVIMVSHDPSAVDYANRVVRMQDGHVINVSEAA